MSFSFVVPVVYGITNIDEAVEAAVAEQIEIAAQHNYESNVKNAIALGWIDPIKAHVLDLAQRLVRRGDSIRVTVSGHANPSTDPNPGWTSNFLTITVTQEYKDDK